MPLFSLPLVGRVDAAKRRTGGEGCARKPHPARQSASRPPHEGEGKYVAPSALIALCLALLLLLPSATLAAPKFPPLTGRVVDNAELLSPAAEQKLTDQLATLEQQTGHQLVIATLPDLQGYEIEDYGYQLLRGWALGRKAEDDGAILLVAPKDRKVRVEVGYGLEPVLTDALSSVIIQTRILPAFKAGKMEAGVVDGAEALIAQLGLPPDQAKAVVTQVAQQRASENEMSAVPIIIGAILVLWVISGVMRMLGGRRRNGLFWWLLPILLDNLGRRGGGGWSGGGGGWSGGGGGGGFSGGGGSGGGGGASGSW